MQDTPSERRMVENEVVFRQLNEQIKDCYGETSRIADESDSNGPLQFFCECSDENCGDKVTINIHDYEDIHKHRDRFVIVPGHEVLQIEDVILEQPEYSIAQKHTTPPESARGLNATDVDNQ